MIKVTWEVVTQYERTFTEEEWAKTCEYLEIRPSIDPQEALDSYGEGKKDRFGDSLTYYDVLADWQYLNYETWSEIRDPLYGAHAKRVPDAE